MRARLNVVLKDTRIERYLTKPCGMRHERAWSLNFCRFSVKSWSKLNAHRNLSSRHEGLGEGREPLNFSSSSLTHQLGNQVHFC